MSQRLGSLLLRAGVGMAIMGGLSFQAGCHNPSEPDSAAQTTTERGPYSLTVSADATEINFGDIVTLSLSVNTPPDTQISFPDSESLEEFDVLNWAVTPAIVSESGDITHTARYEVMPTDTGAVTVPALTIEYEAAAADPNSAPNKNELVSKPLTLNVLSVLDEGDTVETPRDITGTMLPPEAPKPYFWPIVIASILASTGLIALLVWRIIKEVTKPAPPIPADVWALAALDRLDVADPITKDQIQAFYYQLSEIVREYLERQFAIAAPEMTTEEFLIATTRNPRHAQLMNSEMLTSFLDSCDLVKYAAFMPAEHASTEAVASARNFVRESTRAKQRAMQAATPISQEQAA